MSQIQIKIIHKGYYEMFPLWTDDCESFLRAKCIQLAVTSRMPFSHK